MYINPYENLTKGDGQWLKANFHTHAGTGKNTCGAYEIDDVIALYKEAEYDVLTISNHDIYSDVSNYQSKHDIVLLNGIEYSQDPHMLCININNVISGTHQEAINECVKQDGFAILCHPNWQRKEYWQWKEIDMLYGYLGIEIINSLIYRLNGSGLATDTWDYLLSQGKLVWGFGNDDFHRWYDMARSWNVIYSQSRKHNDVTASIRNGSFYASTGLIMKDIAMTDGTIRITANTRDTYIKKYKYIFIGKNGCILSEPEREHGEYKIADDDLYIRIQVIGEHGGMLWTQPIYKKELFKRT
jgi:hypothetical protein